MLGFSSQFASPSLSTVFDTIDPNTRTGSFDTDSTLTWASSATCASTIDAGPAGAAGAAASDGAAPRNAWTTARISATSARSCASSARSAATSADERPAPCASAETGSIDTSTAQDSEHRTLRMRRMITPATTGLARRRGPPGDERGLREAAAGVSGVLGARGAPAARGRVAAACDRVGCGADCAPPDTPRTDAGGYTGPAVNEGSKGVSPKRLASTTRHPGPRDVRSSAGTGSSA